MTNKEKEFIRMITRDLSKIKTKNGMIEYLDYIIVMRKLLTHSDEFMEKLYFIRYYIDKVAFQEVL